MYDFKGNIFKSHFTCKLRIFQSQTNDKTVRQCKSYTQTNFLDNTRKKSLAFLWLFQYYVLRVCLRHFLWANKSNSKVKQESNISWRHLTLAKFTTAKSAVILMARWTASADLSQAFCFNITFSNIHNKTNVK